MILPWKMNISGESVNICLTKRITAMAKLLSIHTSMNSGREVATRKKSSRYENQIPSKFAMMCAEEASWPPRCWPQTKKASNVSSQSEKITKSQTKTSKGILIETRNWVK